MRCRRLRPASLALFGAGAVRVQQAGSCFVAGVGGWVLLAFGVYNYNFKKQKNKESNKNMNKKPEARGEGAPLTPMGLGLQ